MYETLLLEEPTPHIQVITLNRPQVLNAMNTQMGEELRALFRSFDLYREPDLRTLILTGAGERAFCVGADLKERQGMDNVTWRKQHEIFEEALDLIGHFPMPIIAAVNGAVMGGGCELAIACDFLVAGETAVFAQPEVKLGIMPGLGGTQRLPRRIGPNRAKDMVLTGRRVAAAEALSWGLVDRVVPPENVMDEALALAELIAANGPIAVRQAKKSIDRGMDVSLDSGIALEIEAYNVAVPSEDRQEGINAFNEKRPPVFKNR